jgi:hypothetical protein
MTARPVPGEPLLGSSGTFLPVKEGSLMATVSFNEATRVYPGSDVDVSTSQRLGGVQMEGGEPRRDARRGSLPWTV